MDCENYQKKISRMVDGELNREETAQVEAHISQCSQCQSFHKDLLSMRSFFAASPSPAPSKDLSSRVLFAVRQNRFNPKWIAAAAMVLVVLTLGLSLMAPTQEAQAVDKNGLIHYEDILLQNGEMDQNLLKILMTTDNPDEAMRIYSKERRGQ